MNYIIEDNLNFFELIKNTSVKNTYDEDVCLISGSILDKNHITLDCNHKFNYVPLYNDIIQQKLTYNSNNLKKLKINEITCPYCRRINNRLIPYIPIYKNVEKLNGVNNPKEFCIKCNTCEWIFKSGKQKNKSCKNIAFNSKFGLLCETHWKFKKNAFEKNHYLNNIVWNNELENLYKKNTIKTLQKFLKEKNLKISGTKKELVYRLYINKK